MHFDFDNLNNSKFFILQFVLCLYRLIACNVIYHAFCKEGYFHNFNENILTNSWNIAQNNAFHLKILN